MGFENLEQDPPQSCTCEKKFFQWKILYCSTDTTLTPKHYTLVRYVPGFLYLKSAFNNAINNLRKVFF